MDSVLNYFNVFYHKERNIGSIEKQEDMENITIITKIENRATIFFFRVNICVI